MTEMESSERILFISSENVMIPPTNVLLGGRNEDTLYNFKLQTQLFSNEFQFPIKIPIVLMFPNTISLNYPDHCERKSYDLIEFSGLLRVNQEPSLCFNLVN